MYKNHTNHNKSKHNTYSHYLRNSLILSTLSANSADDKLMIFFSFSLENRIRYFMQKETICMKRQILFSGKNKKNISIYCLLKILPSMLNVNDEPFYLPNQETVGLCFQILRYISTINPLKLINT